MKDYKVLKRNMKKNNGDHLIFSLWNKKKLFHLQFQYISVSKLFSPLTLRAILPGFSIFWEEFSSNSSIISYFSTKIIFFLKRQKHFKTKISVILSLPDLWQAICSVLVFCERKLDRSVYLTRAYVNVWWSQTEVF